MILKDLDPISTQDPLARAGRQAEETMAHYLQRAFGSDRELRIFHGLRLEQDGDAAQMDHLVLHRYGVIVVESKSVTSRVVVNEHGEWKRCHRGSQSGMPSPILQARRQLEFLHVYLKAHQDELLEKFLMGKLQKTFTCMERDVLVAISDAGIIERPHGMELPEVCKADQAPDRIRTILARHRKANSILNLSWKEGGWAFSQDELLRVAQFLLEHHRPLGIPSETVRREPQVPTRAVAVEGRIIERQSFSTPTAPHPHSAPTCRHCGDPAINIEWGRYGYYFKCRRCDGNTPIRESCPACGARARITKKGTHFFAHCLTCGTSRPYWQNPAQS